MHGPSPVVNCNLSASAAVSSLAPNGTRWPVVVKTLIPAPVTGRALAAAFINRVGNSSGPGSSGKLDTWDRFAISAVRSTCNGSRQPSVSRGRPYALSDLDRDGADGE